MKYLTQIKRFFMMHDARLVVIILKEYYSQMLSFCLDSLNLILKSSNVNNVFQYMEAAMKY